MNNIAFKIEQMIKESIKAKGLVKTGRMYNSIKVIETNNGYSIKAVDYFDPVNEEYNIVNDVVNSNELKLFIQKSIEDELAKDLKF